MQKIHTTELIATQRRTPQSRDSDPDAMFILVAVPVLYISRSLERYSSRTVINELSDS